LLSTTFAVSAISVSVRVFRVSSQLRSGRPVADLDDGVMWPVAFALKTLTAAEETKIRALVAKAAG